MALKNNLPFPEVAKTLRVSMHPRAFERLCAVSGLICLLLFFLSLIISDFLPPLRPTLSATEVVSHYRHHTAGIKAGASLMSLSGLFYAPYTAAISTQMKRIPGVGHVVISTQLCAGAFACLTFLVPAMTFATTVYRLDRPPEITQALNDLSWLYLVMPWQPFLPQNVAFVYAILSDRRQKPLFPHWVGWFNIIFTICFMPAIGVHCVRTGPIAWNGGISFWLGGAAFALQFFMNTFYIWKAIGTTLPDEE